MAKMMSRELARPEVTRKWRNFAGSHMEVAVEGLKRGFCVSLRFYRAVTRRRWPSHDRKRRYVT